MPLTRTLPTVIIAETDSARQGARSASFLVFFLLQRMDNFFLTFVQNSFFLIEYKLSEFLGLLALINMILMDERSFSLNTNAPVHSTQSEATHVQIEKLHELADQTEHALQTAIDANVQRNDKLNSLLDRSDLLLHKNQAFGAGIMDLRKEIERKRSINKLKYIAIGILLLMIIILVVILNLVLDHTNSLTDRSTHIILE